MTGRSIVVEFRAALLVDTTDINFMLLAVMRVHVWLLIWWKLEPKLAP